MTDPADPGHPQPSAVERARAIFVRDHEHEPTLVVRAPGRVNLIGEHTDYNRGFSLPMALPFDVAIAAVPASGNRIEAYSEGFGAASVAIEDDPHTTDGWARYLHGTAHLLGADGHKVAGWTGVLTTDIPTGASLSSSAALEVAGALTTLAAAGATADAHTLARIGQRVENEIMGLPSGILDQLASAASERGKAALIDFDTLDVRTVQLPDSATIVIMDSGTRRELVDSEYAARRQSCETAATQLGIESLRNATEHMIEALDDDVLHRRARHVVTENERTLAAVAAFESGDLIKAGELMVASHASLRDDYEVTGPATDLIVEIANTAPGCFGARMTGGGFAGGTVALVERDAVDEFIAYMAATYAAPPEQPATEPVAFWPVTACQGAEVIDQP